MSKDLIENVSELNDSVKSYIKTKVDLIKLSILEKTTRFISYIFSMLVIILFSIMVIGFLFAAFAVWYGQTSGNYYAGLLIAAGCMVIIAALFIMLRNKIITNSVIKKFAEIIYEED